MYRAFKRLFDIVSAFLVLLIFSPIFLLICILIKFDSRGPILFKQKRAGENGSLFYDL